MYKIGKSANRRTRVLKTYQHNLEPLKSLSQTRSALVCLILTVAGLNGAGTAWAQNQTHSNAQVQARPAGRSRSASSAHGARVRTSARPTAVTALLARGAALHKEGKVEEAEAIFREVLAHDPRSVDAFYDLGAIAEGRGDLIGALSDYRAALALRAGDRELQEAVVSTEAALRKSIARKETPKDGQKEATKSSPMGANPHGSGEKEMDAVSHRLNPATAPESGLASSPSSSSSSSSSSSPSSSSSSIPSSDTASLGVPLAESSPASSTEITSAASAGDTASNQDSPIFSVPQADAIPAALDSKTFSLSSRKGAIIAPSVGVPLGESDVPRLGISPDQFPEPGTFKTGTNVGVCPPPCPPPPVVGQAQTNHQSNLRRGAAMMIGIGAGMMLGGALHCPICHMMSVGHF